MVRCDVGDVSVRKGATGAAVGASASKGKGFQSHQFQYGYGFDNAHVKGYAQASKSVSKGEGEAKDKTCLYEQHGQQHEEELHLRDPLEEVVGVVLEGHVDLVERDRGEADEDREGRLDGRS